MEKRNPESDTPDNVLEAAAIAFAAILELVDQSPDNIEPCMDIAYGFIVLANMTATASLPDVNLNEYLAYLQDIQKPQPDDNQREYEIRMRDSFRKTVQDFIDANLPLDSKKSPEA